jgi:phosphonate transport system ATP-binding protein
MINRLTDASSGRVLCDDVFPEEVDVCTLKGRRVREWRARCAMVFQQFNLVPRLDVMTNVLMGRLSYQPTYRSVLKLFTPQERALAVMTLDRVEMAPFILQRCDTLSGGQQQRVAIARALVQEPRILLADEPIASLDPRSAARVMEILRTINREDGITVICNLHTLDTARIYCDRMIGLRNGRMVFDGGPRTLDRNGIQEIYGGEGEEDVDENVTSMSSARMASFGAA